MPIFDEDTRLNVKIMLIQSLSHYKTDSSQNNF